MSAQPQTGAQTSSTFTLLLFASAQTYCSNTESLRWSAPTTLRQVCNDLEEKFPGFGEKVLRASGVTVNLDYVDFEYDRDVLGEGEGGQYVVQPGDEIGIIPPVSSG